MLELALRYLKQDKESGNSNEEPSFDFEQDQSYINASFMSDYHIDLEKSDMHWWTYCDLLNGLTEDCVLNRVRYIREFDINEIKDHKERSKMLKAKESVSLKRKEHIITESEKKAHNKFMQMAKLTCN